MPLRNAVPLVLLAVLALGTLAFAIVGASAAPSGATLAVQNASTQTFGSPTGSTTFTLDLVATVSAASGGARESSVRQVRYVPPHMAVSLVRSQGTPGRTLLLTPPAVACALDTYTSLVGGGTPWTPSGTIYVRTESLADYSSRVPDVVGTTCEPHPAAVQGTVHERASLRSGYLVGLRFTIDVPAQTVGSGSQATAGTEDEAIVLTEIAGTSTRALARG